MWIIQKYKLFVFFNKQNKKTGILNIFIPIWILVFLLLFPILTIFFTLKWYKILFEYEKVLLNQATNSLIILSIFVVIAILSFIVISYRLFQKTSFYKKLYSIILEYYNINPSIVFKMIEEWKTIEYIKNIVDNNKYIDKVINSVKKVFSQDTLFEKITKDFINYSDKDITKEWNIQKVKEEFIYQKEKEIRDEKYEKENEERKLLLERQKEEEEERKKEEEKQSIILKKTENDLLRNSIKRKIFQVENEVKEIINV